VLVVHPEEYRRRGEAGDDGRGAIQSPPLLRERTAVRGPLRPELDSLKFLDLLGHGYSEIDGDTSKCNAACSHPGTPWFAEMPCFTQR
jgi:hypothetical protein